MTTYNLTIDNLVVDNASPVDYQSLVIAHNVLHALLAPHSQDSKKMIECLDTYVIGSRFFNQEKALTFRDSVAEFYRIDAEPIESLKREVYLAKALANPELQEKKSKLHDIFKNHMRPYINETKPLILNILPVQYRYNKPAPYIPN